MSDSQFKFQSRTFYVPVIAIVIIWVVYFIEIKFNFNFNKYGIYPQTFKGLRGIVLSPFIHGDFKHLFNKIRSLGLSFSFDINAYCEPCSYLLKIIGSRQWVIYTLDLSPSIPSLGNVTTHLNHVKSITK